MENVILGTHNFLLFVILFTISLTFAVLTFVSYKRSILAYINTGMFVLCAVRACSEFGMQTTNSFEEVYPYILSNSIIAHLAFTLSWYLLYYYILPFKYFKNHKIINIIVSVFVIGIPNLVIFFFFLTFQCFEFSPEKIDGFWMFRPLPGPVLTFYQTYTFLIMIGIYTSAIMIYSIATNPLTRKKQIVLLLGFYCVTFCIISGFIGYSSGSWKVVNYTILMLFDSIIITWFISGYRLLGDQYKIASVDVVNSISELVIRTDKQFKVLDQNIAAQEFFNINTDHLSAFFKNVKFSNQSANLNYLVENFNHFEEVEIKKEQNTCFLKVRVAPYHWRGKNVGYTFILSDITALKESEQALAVSNRTKDQLFSIISHDLRKPALAFRGIIKKINNLLKKEDYARLNLLGNSIENSAQSLNSLLDNLLQWSLSQKDGIRPRYQKFRVKDVVEDLRKQFEIISKEKQIILDTTGVDKELEICNDPDLISTILRNIIDNSIKYSNPQNTVYVRGAELQDYIHISVKDEGIGMTDDQQIKLERLYENKSTRGTQGERGSGLGMTLVYELIGFTQGELKLNSKKGVGTEFTLIYPKV